MDGIGFVLVILAVIFSIVGEAAKKKRPPGAPPQPPRRMPPARPAPRTLPVPPPRSGGTEPQAGRAAEMLPEDFWRELTGQPRREPATPEPMPSPEVPSWDEEAVAALETESRELQTREEGRSLEEYRRPEIVRRAPVIVNRDRDIPTVEQRHTAFHQKVDTSKATLPATVTSRPSSAWLDRLRAQGAAREAVVFAEIFGRPKGLEDDSPRG